MGVWCCWEGGGGFTGVCVIVGWGAIVPLVWVPVVCASLWAAAFILYSNMVLVCVGGQVAPPMCMLQVVDSVLFLGGFLVAPST